LQLVIHNAQRPLHLLQPASLLLFKLSKGSLLLFQPESLLLFNLQQRFS
jgi:hypothetical protein